MAWWDTCDFALRCAIDPGPPLESRASNRNRVSSPRAANSQVLTFLTPRYKESCYHLIRHVYTLGPPWRCATHRAILVPWSLLYSQPDWKRAMNLRVIVALIAVLALSSGTRPAFAGPDGAIDLFGTIADIPSALKENTDFGRCSGVTRSQFGGIIIDISVHIYARLRGASAAGITGAEFYVLGWEAIAAQGFTVSESFNPAALFVLGAASKPSGNLGNTRRVNVVFSTCMPNPMIGGEFVFLGAITAQGIGVGDIPANTYLSVVAGDPPPNPNFRCPLFTRCDAPSYSIVCVTGGEFIINPDGRDCTVAVGEQTWSKVKSLYR